MRWVVAALVGLVGAWMTLDGARALTVGDYVTPRSGEYAGRLGPWSGVVERVGLKPRSATMKIGFVLMGLIHLAGAATLVVGDAPEGGWALLAAASGLWYLPFGTVADTAAIILIVSTSLNPWT